MDRDDDSHQQPDIQTLYSTLTNQATTLLDELTLFRTYLENNPLIHRPDMLINKFQVDVKREVAYLRRYGGSGDEAAAQHPYVSEGQSQVEGSTTNGSVEVATPHMENLSLDGIHRIRSSNITFLAGVWEALKRRKGVVGVRKTVRYAPVGLGLGTPGAQQRQQHTVTGELDIDVQPEKRVSKKMSREARERAAAIKAAKLTVNDDTRGAGAGDGDDADANANGSGSKSLPYQASPAEQTTTIPTLPSNPNSPIDQNNQKHEHQPTQPKPRGKLNSKGMISRRDKEVVTVDIMADYGETWIKMFTKNLRWLMMDFAREGFVDVDGGSGSDGEEDGAEAEEKENGGGRVRRGDVFGQEEEGEALLANGGHLGVGGERQQQAYDEDMEELKLVKMAREYLSASRTVRVGRGHRHPRVQFQLPKISRGISRDVDKVMRYMQNIGIEVLTAEELQEHSEINGHTKNEATENGGSHGQEYESGLQETFEQMMSPLPSLPITDTLNVDCTVLIALISDVSHFRSSDITIPEHYKGSARRDIEVQLRTDIDDPLLPNHIYPILRGRRLVCTKKAVEHWRNIVRIMGSPTEAERCRILLGETSTDCSGYNSKRKHLQSLSTHELPNDLQIPFEVVDFDIDGMNVEGGNNCKSIEIDVMRELVNEPRLSSLNCSVFFHGWYEDLTTVSLNRVVSEWLNRAISVVLDRMELRKGLSYDIAEVTKLQGPNILICGRERSLLGSEK